MSNDVIRQIKQILPGRQCKKLEIKEMIANNARNQVWRVSCDTRSDTHSDTHSDTRSETRGGIRGDTHSTNRECIMKLIQIHPTFQGIVRKQREENIIREVTLQEELSHMGLAPDIIDACLTPEGGTIVMEKMEMTVDELLDKYTDIEVRRMIILECLSLIKKLHSLGFFHGDTHLENFMVESHPLFIDKEQTSKLSTQKDDYINQNYIFKFIDMEDTMKSTSKAKRRTDYSIFMEDVLEKTSDDPQVKQMVNDMFLSEGI